MRLVKADGSIAQAISVRNVRPLVSLIVERGCIIELWVPLDDPIMKI